MRTGLTAVTVSGSLTDNKPHCKTFPFAYIWDSQDMLDSSPTIVDMSDEHYLWQNCLFCWTDKCR